MLRNVKHSTPGGKSSGTVDSAGNVYSLNTAVPGAKRQLVCTAPAFVTNASERVFAAAAYLECRPLRGKPFSHLIYAKAGLAAPEKANI
ncbi:unnamed protein product [Heligmosomoides polygyrus]|uniref:Piwi domain-containing protein n=1 Tax=Heligmosomoides polygyrus TaxID=6339 RepID=A0A183GLK1_HELPZ|nr:unnamed protein product [Heligmosomoides polygyrus]